MNHFLKNPDAHRRLARGANALCNITPGDFLHPLGTCYTLEVTAVIQPDDEQPGQIQCRRWGVDEYNQPRQDENGHGARYLPLLEHLRGNRWQNKNAVWMEPTEYAHTPIAGQMELF